MRRLFTTDDIGLTTSALRWGERTGQWRRVARRVYAEGPEDPSPLDVARARVLSGDTVARGCLAGALHGLDGVSIEACGTGRPRCIPPTPERVVTVGGITCADGLLTMVDLAATLDDLAWEQALESALRKGLTTVIDLERILPCLCRSRIGGTRRIRRVLAGRPVGAAPTGSLLETLMVQLARAVPGLGYPVRQYCVTDAHGQFVAYVDLAWPDLGFFRELDGQQHKGQPLYDARRETAVVAATGWLTGRFTWTEVVRLPTTTRRRLAALAAQARRRPMASEFPTAS